MECRLGHPLCHPGSFKNYVYEMGPKPLTSQVFGNKKNMNMVKFMATCTCISDDLQSSSIIIIHIYNHLHTSTIIYILSCSRHVTCPIRAHNDEGPKKLSNLQIQRSLNRIRKNGLASSDDKRSDMPSFRT